MSNGKDLPSSKLVCAPDCDPDTLLIVAQLPDDALIYAHPKLCEGNDVIAKPDAYADGSLVIAVTEEGDRVVRFLFWEGDGSIRLEGANPEFDSLTFKPHQVKIEGRVFRVCVSCERGECHALDSLHFPLFDLAREV